VLDNPTPAITLPATETNVPIDVSAVTDIEDLHIPLPDTKTADPMIADPILDMYDPSSVAPPMEVADPPNTWPEMEAVSPSPVEPRMLAVHAIRIQSDKLIGEPINADERTDNCDPVKHLSESET